ncbi:hypothetical protein ACFY36_47175 [Actinoplanes sp. NPDC000266]
MPMIIGRAAAALLLVLLPATPASAAPATPTAEAHLGRITVAPGGPVRGTLLWLRAENIAEDDTHRVALSLDLGNAEKLAEFDLSLTNFGTTAAGTVADEVDDVVSTAPDGPCRATGPVIECVWTDAFFADGTLPVAALIARPRAKVETGDTAEIELTARIGDGPARTTRAEIRVGEAVDLDAGAHQDVSARPGSRAKVTPKVRNSGSKAVEGAVLYLHADGRLLEKSSFSNCRYTEDQIVCTFDEPLRPGRTYRTSAPLTLRPPADSAAGSQSDLMHQWFTPTDFEAIAESNLWDEPGEPGTGAPLTLEELVAAQAAPQSDVQPENDYAGVTLTVTGSLKRRAVAVGAHPSSAVGDRLTIGAGALWRGPGRLQPDLYPNNTLLSVVRLPGNVEPVEVDERCWDKEEPGLYVCADREALGPGQRQMFAFTVETEKPCGDAGSVEVTDVQPEINAWRAGRRDDGTAAITVTVPGARCALPITGPGELWAAGAGAALVAVGLLLAVRRRRSAVCAHAVGERWPG